MNAIREVALSITQGEYIRLLATGVPGRIGKLKGLGNAIVPELAAEFIRAFAG